MKIGEENIIVIYRYDFLFYLKTQENQMKNHQKQPNMVRSTKLIQLEKLIESLYKHLSS